MGDRIKVPGSPESHGRGQDGADPTDQPGQSRYSAEEGRPVPVDIDPTVPSPARMYDYYLGGKDNYAADREAAEQALSAVPHGRQIALANRKFLARAVVLMADHGIRQFIDLGTGIPTSPNVHELARSVQPAARVLYVDNDPVVTAHNRALLAKDGGIVAIDGDIRDPHGILASPERQQLIDLHQPVGILFVAVLHFVTDADDPYGVVETFKQAMAKGSFLALSHIVSDGTGPEVIAGVQEVYAKASAPAVFRTEAEIRRFFEGFDLERPGLVDVADWFPYNRVFSAKPPALRFLSGVGRKP
jgi:hypothetical protein